MGDNKQKKFETKKIFSLDSEKNLDFPKTSVSEDINETNENLAKKSKEYKENSIKKITGFSLNIFKQKKLENIDFYNLFKQKNFRENIEKILEKKDLMQKNNFWDNLDNFIEKSKNSEEIEKYLDILDLRKNSCPSDKFILKIRKNLEKLLYKDLEKKLKGYKTKDGKDAYEAMQEEMKKDYCFFDLKKFLDSLEDENGKKLDRENFYKISKKFNSIKEQKIEEEIYKTIGYTTTSLAYLEKKDLDKIVENLDQKKKKKLKKLFKQKKVIEEIKKNSKNSGDFEKFLKDFDKEEKEEVKKNILQKTNYEIIDYILDSEKKEFDFSLGETKQEKVNLKIIKNDDFFEVKVGESSVRCENLFELENILDTAKYFDELGFSFLIPYFEKIFYYFRKIFHFRFDFKDGLNLEEHKKIQEILALLLDIKNLDGDLGKKDEKIKDLGNSGKNFFYLKAIETEWFKDGKFRELEFEKVLEVYFFTFL